MAMVVSHNIPALQAYNAVSTTTNALQKAVNKLSTGLRINSAADDAAGLAISEKMRAQTRGLDRAAANAQDGISMIQTAEGALSETHSILQRMRELAVQAANDTLTQEDRGYIQLEIDQLREEITRIGNTTQFNKKKLLDGSAAVIWSSDNLSTKAIINGGLRSIDQFGQKLTAEGNYVIDINATAGKAQVQKTNIFEIKHPDVIMNVSINTHAGINGIRVNTIPAGEYSVSLGTDKANQAAGITPGTLEAIGGASALQDLSIQIFNYVTADSTYTFTVEALNSDGTVRFGILRDGSDSRTALHVKTVTLSIGTAGVTNEQVLVYVSGVDVAANKTADGAVIMRGALGGVKLSALKEGMQISYNVGAATPKNPPLKLIASSTDTNLDKLEVITVKNNPIILGPDKGIIRLTISGNARSAYAIVKTEYYYPDGATLINTAADLNRYVLFRSGTHAVGDITTSIEFAGGAKLQLKLGANLAGVAVNTDTVDITFEAQNYAKFKDGDANFSGIKIQLVSAGDHAPGLDFAVKVVNTGTKFEIVATVNEGSRKGMVYGTILVSAAYQGKVEFNAGGYRYVMDLAGSKVSAVAKNSVGVFSGISTVTEGTPATIRAISKLENVVVGGLNGIDHEGKGTIVFGDYDEGRSAINYTYTYTKTDGTQSSVAGYLSAVKVGTTPIVMTAGAGGSAYNVTFTIADKNAMKDLAGSEFKFDFGPEITAGEDGARLVGRYGVGAGAQVKIDDTRADKNANVLLTFKGHSTASNEVTFDVKINLLSVDGVTVSRTDEITVGTGSTSVIRVGGGDGIDLVLTFTAASFASEFKVGSKLAYSIQAKEDLGGQVFDVKGVQNDEWDGRWGSAGNSVSLDTVSYRLNTNEVQGTEVHFRNFYINEKNGKVYEGDIILDAAQNFASAIAVMAANDSDATLATFEATFVGQVAERDVTLYDLKQFWNSEGRFLLDDPQTLTITQGDGTQTKVTLYGTDTLGDVTSKLNQAIGENLGQNALLTDDKGHKGANSFVTFVTDVRETTSEAAEGTIVIRSIIAGANGEINFAGDEDMLKALGLNELQEAEENKFTITIRDAHNGNGDPRMTDVKITGNKLVGIVDPNVDIVFDAMANVQAVWNEDKKAFDLSKAEGSYTTVLHLADNTTVFQIGANEGEDMGINLGDMRSESLGLNKVLVTDRESAARSITVIDAAINKVSSQRARLGAYQNRLEHTITNLTVASENLTAAESRIRDTDMAKEMMNFTKLQILMQAGTSMLAQANTLPQNVLSLLR